MDAGLAQRMERDIVRVSHWGLDLAELWQALEERLGRVVPYDINPCWITIDPDTLLFTGHSNAYLEGDPELRRRIVTALAANEYGQEDVNKFADLRGDERAATLLEATGGHPERSARYRELLQPFQLEDELRLALVAGSACWGGVALYRSAEAGPFGKAEVEFARSLSEHVAHAVRTALLLRAATPADTAEATGLVILDLDSNVEAITEPAARWIEQLIEVGEPGRNSLPQAVYAVAAAAASAGEEGDPGAARASWARVPTRSGRWLLLHGTRVPRSDRREIAVIIEPARGADLAPLMLEAYGLSAREQEVVGLVLRGLSTREIASTLFLSPHTVQDHLKSIFEKVGVGSRRELAAAIFFDRCLPALVGEG